MYQANPFRASPSQIIFLLFGPCPGGVAFLADFWWKNGLQGREKGSSKSLPCAAGQRTEQA